MRESRHIVGDEGLVILPRTALPSRHFHAKLHVGRLSCLSNRWTVEEDPNGLKFAFVAESEAGAPRCCDTPAPCQSRPGRLQGNPMLRKKSEGTIYEEWPWRVAEVTSRQWWCSKSRSEPMLISGLSQTVCTRADSPTVCVMAARHSVEGRRVGRTSIASSALVPDKKVLDSIGARHDALDDGEQVHL